MEALSFAILKTREGTTTTTTLEDVLMRVSMTTNETELHRSDFFDGDDQNIKGESFNGDEKKKKTKKKKIKKERKCARYRRYRDGATGKRFYFDVVAKTSSWRHPLFFTRVQNECDDDDDDDDDAKKRGGGGGKTKTTTTTSSVFVAKEGIVEVRREEEGHQSDEDDAWYRVDDRRLTRPYWFKNNETKERRWENPTKKKEEREEEKEEEEEEEEREESEDEDIEFDPDAYENNDEEDRAEHEKTRLSREDRDDATRATTTSRENGPKATASRDAAGVDDDKEEERDEDEDEDEPTTIAAADILNEKVRAKSKALNAFFALCEKAGINEHSRWERDMPKLRKLDKKAFECFATMPERRNAFNKYKVKLTSNAAAATKKESKESKLEREQIAREKRKREILEKKRDDEYRLKKLRRNQDKGDAMKQFETLLSESIKAIDEVETFDDVRELLSQDPLGRASSDGPLSEADMVAAFDKFLLNFKTVSAQRYEELCQETVSALSQSVGGVAEEEDEVFAWEVARDVLKEDARFDRCPMKLRRSTFEKAIQNFRDQRIRNADASGAL